MFGDARGGGLAEVVREFRIRRTGVRDQRFGNLTMEPDPLVGAELVDERRAHQRVRERVPAEAALDLVDQACGERFVEAVDGVVFGTARDRGDDAGIELAPDDRCDAQHRVRVFGQS